MKELEEAKASGDKSRMKEAVIEMLRPEAREAVRLAEKDITHKDGYSVMMRTASKMGAYRGVFFEACIREGYPRETIEQITSISN